MRTATVVRKAVFPVAGRGTRFLPATKAVPKEMLPLIDRPLIAYAVEEALASGIEDLIFVTAPGKDSILAHFEADPDLISALEKSGKTSLARSLQREAVAAGRICVVEQAEPLGLGHAILCARQFVGDEPFAVILPDDIIMSGQPCIGQLIESYANVGGNLAAVMDVPRAETKSYGILRIESETGGLVKSSGLVEKPAPEDAPSTIAIVGRYVLEPSIFDSLEGGRAGSGGEIQLTDAIADALSHVPFHGVRFSGTRFDCGCKEGFLTATIAHALERQDLSEAMHGILGGYAKSMSLLEGGNR